jgi:hypothetical protein
MTGLDYLNNYLSDVEQDRFINNVIEFNPDGFLSDTLDSTHGSLLEFLGYAFCWRDTPEGHDFWEEIATSNLKTKQL